MPRALGLLLVAYVPYAVSFALQETITVRMPVARTGGILAIKVPDRAENGGAYDGARRVVHGAGCRRGSTGAKQPRVPRSWKRPRQARVSRARVLWWACTPLRVEP
jgi:hypothetical protein